MYKAIKHALKEQIAMWYFQIVRCYAFLYGLCKDYFKINIRGFGFLLRRINIDAVLEVKGKKIYFDHRAAESYSRLLSGDWNEPETNLFLSFLYARLSRPDFIEVGANIGEILIDVASYSNAGCCFAFEPNPQCARVIKENVGLNKLGNVIVKEMAIGETEGKVSMWFGSHAPTASMHSEESRSGVGVEVQMSTLDREINFKSLGDYVVMLVDVEGYEPHVLRGGAVLIRQKRPLVIFEYNYSSKHYFNVAEIVSILGSGYQIYRLRRDSMLDHDVEMAWNCVAVPENSVFADICRDRIIS